MSDLPQPNEAYEWVQAAGGPSLVCRTLARYARHLYTTRLWALAADNRPTWDEVAGALELGPSGLVRVRQVHGASVLVARESQASPGIVDADIIVASGTAGTLGLAVQAADCVPLLIADQRTRAVAAAHAGWRGLAAGVPSTAVAAMTRQFGSAPSDLVAAIGPSIGACCYEVGADVKERFEEAGVARERIAGWFHDGPVASRRNPPMPGLARSSREHWFLDGWSVARDQLVDAGVPLDQIFVAELCTASHPATLCSYRRDGARAGRIAAAIRPLPLDP